MFYEAFLCKESLSLFIVGFSVKCITKQFTACCQIISAGRFGEIMSSLWAAQYPAILHHYVSLRVVRVFLKRCFAFYWSALRLSRRRVAAHMGRHEQNISSAAR